MLHTFVRKQNNSDTALASGGPPLVPGPHFGKHKFTLLGDASFTDSTAEDCVCAIDSMFI